MERIEILRDLVNEALLVNPSIHGKVHIKQTPKYYILDGEQADWAWRSYPYAKIEKTTGNILTPSGTKPIANINDADYGASIVSPGCVYHSNSHKVNGRENEYYRDVILKGGSNVYNKLNLGEIPSLTGSI